MCKASMICMGRARVPKRLTSFVTLLLAGAMAAVLAPSRASADVFNLGDPNLKNLELVTVGDPGNAPNNNAGAANGMGTVGYTYSIGKYDVTAAQYCQFLNAVASQSDPFGLYWNPMSGYPGTGACGITRTGTAGSYVYTTALAGYTTANNGNFPVNGVSWGSAARFCNWLTNGQPLGPAGAGTTETGSYTLNGAIDDGNLLLVTRSANARYVLPSGNEWYKAAYYKGGSKNAGYWFYTTESNTAPSNVLSAAGTNNANYNTGDLNQNAFTDSVNLLTEVGAFASSPGPYGTFDMGGDMMQWSEGNSAPYFRVSWGVWAAKRGPDGWTAMVISAASPGCGAVPTSRDLATGFRIAEVPEPAVLALLGSGALFILTKRRSWARK